MPKFITGYVHPHISPAASEPLPLAPILRPAHCPLCTFQSAFWQAASQYAATAHTEHFFSGTPVIPQDQQLFLGRGGRCREAAGEGEAAAADAVGGERARAEVEAGAGAGAEGLRAEVETGAGVKEKAEGEAEEAEEAEAEAATTTSDLPSNRARISA